jgi:hypothetical protein
MREGPTCVCVIGTRAPARHYSDRQWRAPGLSARPDHIEAVGKIKYQAGAIDIPAEIQLQTAQIEGEMQIVPTLDSQRNMPKRHRSNLPYLSQATVAPGAWTP